MHQQFNTSATQHQPILALPDRRAGLWRVGMQVLDGRTSYQIWCEGYAASSIDATGQARTWAEGRVSEISDGLKVRVVEVLQVGV